MDRERTLEELIAQLPPYIDGCVELFIKVCDVNDYEAYYMDEYDHSSCRYYCYGEDLKEVLVELYNKLSEEEKNFHKIVKGE